MALLNNCCKTKFLFFYLIFTQSIFAEESIGNALYLSDQQKQNYKQNNIKILSAFLLDRHTTTDEKLMEFSGLAWDNDQQLLYALSDRGFVVHLRPVFQEDMLTGIYLVDKHHLKDTGGKKLQHKHADSEGLALINSNNNQQDDTELLVSFERVPRIIRYSVKGNFISNEKINPILKDIKNYASANKSLEAITEHNEFNIITGPERPLKDSDQNELSLFSLKNDQWSFKPENEKYESLVGLTTLPDGSMIALERTFPGIFAGVTNVLYKLKINNNTLIQRKLVSIQPSDGYFNDNFEGISWHRDNRFFMISDDNDNLLQRTILLYFEILNLDNTDR